MSGFGSGLILPLLDEDIIYLNIMNYTFAFHHSKDGNCFVHVSVLEKAIQQNSICYDIWLITLFKHFMEKVVHLSRSTHPKETMYDGAVGLNIGF